MDPATAGFDGPTGALLALRVSETTLLKSNNVLVAPGRPGSLRTLRAVAGGRLPPGVVGATEVPEVPLRSDPGDSVMSPLSERSVPVAREGGGLLASKALVRGETVPPRSAPGPARDARPVLVALLAANGLPPLDVPLAAPGGAPLAAVTGTGPGPGLVEVGGLVGASPLATVPALGCAGSASRLARVEREVASGDEPFPAAAPLWVAASV
jgi:hypothetical protein